MYDELTAYKMLPFSNLKMWNSIRHFYWTDTRPRLITIVAILLSQSYG